MPPWTYHLLFSPHGRIGRATYIMGWFLSLGMAGIMVILLLGIASLVGIPLTEPASTTHVWWYRPPFGISLPLLLLLSIGAGIFWFFMIFCLDAKRLHDMGQTAWWFPVAFCVPSGNSILTLVLMLAVGERGKENRFGPDPFLSRSEASSQNPFIIS